MFKKKKETVLLWVKPNVSFNFSIDENILDYLFIYLFAGPNCFPKFKIVQEKQNH